MGSDGFEPAAWYNIIMPRYPVPERGPHLDFSRLIAKRIADRRRVLGMSQENLANYLGVSRDMITRIETDRSTLDAGDIPALALALRVPISYFYAVRTSEEADIVRDNSINDSIKRLSTRLKGRSALNTDITDEEQKALEATQGILTSLSHYQAALARQGDPEVSEMLRSLDSDLAGALTDMARILYALQLNRSFSAKQTTGNDVPGQMEGANSSTDAAMVGDKFQVPAGEGNTFFQAYEDEIIGEYSAENAAVDWLDSYDRRHGRD